MPIQRLTIENFRGFPEKPTSIPNGNTALSPGISLFVGPNGCGKTTILNATALAFGRGQVCSQRNFHFPPPNSPEARREHFNPDLPWKVEVTFDYGPPALKGIIQVSGEPDKPVTRHLNGRDVGFRDDSDPLLSELYDRVFPVGWPRQFWKLEQTAFRKPPGKNSEHYARNWPRIQRVLKQALGTALCNSHEILSAGDLTCPLCGERQKEPIIGENFLDKNGFPLTRSSDGEAHFAYMILEILKHPDPTTFLIEEPDVFMHPGLQKVFLETIRELHESLNHQFILTSHSPYFLDVTARWKQEPESPNQIFRMKYDKCARIEEKTPTDDWIVLSELGHRPSDVMHPNGIIWVEGPSDVIYLDTWLQAWLRDSSGPSLLRGLHYEILPFGGANVANIEFSAGEREITPEKISNLLRFNRNAGILIDRDRQHDRMRPHKVRLLSSFQEHACPAFLTYPRCIEGYVRSTLREACSLPLDLQPPWRKVYSARRYETLAKSLSFEQLIEPGQDLSLILRSFCETILSWK